MYYLCTAKRKTKCARPHAQVAELVDAHVSGACAARCAGSSPALGTKVPDNLPIAGDTYFHYGPRWSRYLTTIFLPWWM